MNLALTLSRSRDAAIVGTLGVVLLVAILFSLTVGAVAIPISDVMVILLKRLGLFAGVDVNGMHEIVMESIRLPRILLTVLIGGALGVSGAALQGLFRNPLVEPSLIGVSGGSAAFVVLVIVFGGAFALPNEGWAFDLVLPAVAFVGGLIATLLVLRLASQQGRTNIAVLVLVGVAMNAFCGAIIGLSIFFADENQLRTFTFWTLGDLGGATWAKCIIAAPVLIVAPALLLVHARALNALALGEAEAFHMGVDVERTKLKIILLSALAVGVSVSMSGMIGFIGLVIPHLIRILFHPDNRLVLPASILGGALLLVLSDIVARTVVMPSELPIGVVTAFIGAPFFMGLLIKAKKKNEL